MGCLFLLGLGLACGDDTSGDSAADMGGDDSCASICGCDGCPDTSGSPGDDSGTAESGTAEGGGSGDGSTGSSGSSEGGGPDSGGDETSTTAGDGGSEGGGVCVCDPADPVWVECPTDTLGCSDFGVDSECCHPDGYVQVCIANDIGTTWMNQDDC